MFFKHALEKVARFVKKLTSYIVKQIGEKNLYHLLSCAQALHCDNPEKVQENGSMIMQFKKAILSVTKRMMLLIQGKEIQKIFWNN